MRHHFHCVVDICVYYSPSELLLHAVAIVILPRRAVKCYIPISHREKANKRWMHGYIATAAWALIRKDNNNHLGPAKEHWFSVGSYSSEMNLSIARTIYRFHCPKLIRLSRFGRGRESLRLRCWPGYAIFCWDLLSWAEVQSFFLWPM
jgi:hypothetical protein